jgi:hypothetical protein
MRVRTRFAPSHHAVKTLRLGYKHQSGLHWESNRGSKTTEIRYVERQNVELLDIKLGIIQLTVTSTI